LRADVANLDFETTLDGTVAVVAPTGELDLSGATVLEVEFERLEREPGVDAIVLDLRRLEFMDSSGLRLIAVTDMRSREAGRRFALVAGAETVQRVFEITKMTDRLDFVAGPEQVIEEAERS
jgi:anti-sigma B factor antagonist